jgi:uncharacterized protein (DUF433 family)
MAAVRALKDTPCDREITAAEAAAMPSLTDTQVNNLIDELAPLGIAHSRNRKRSIELRGLFALRLCRDLIAWDVGPALRLKIVQAALDAPRNETVSIGGTNIVSMQVGKYLKEANARFRALLEAEGIVTRNPEIMRGEPCIRGTRIPVYAFAELVDSDGVAEARSAYPQLSERVVRAAHLYAAANPRRGRPREIKWPLGREIKGRSRTRTVRID